MNPKIALAEYEALIHRTRATIDFDDDTGTDQTVLHQALNLLIYEERERITRTKARLSHRLAEHQDLLVQLNHYTKNAIEHIVAGAAGIEPIRLENWQRHTLDDAVAVARMIFHISNLSAIRQMEGEIIGREPHDDARYGYIEALLNLLDQTKTSSRCLYTNALTPKRTEELGVKTLADQSEQAVQQSELIAERYRGQSFKGRIETHAIVDQIISRALPTECAVKLPTRRMSEIEMLVICEATIQALNTMADLSDRWTAAGHWEAVQSVNLVAGHYSERVADTAYKIEPPDEDEPGYRVNLDLAEAIEEIERVSGRMNKHPEGQPDAYREVWNDQMTNARRQLTAGVALAGHTKALGYLLSRIVTCTDDELAAAISSATWVNENVIRETIKMEPPNDPESMTIWNEAQYKLEELDRGDTPASRAIKRLQPLRLSPALASPLMADEVEDATRTNSHTGQYGSTITQVAGVSPEEWIFQYQYQGALHAKLLGEPYNHGIDLATVLDHMEDVERLASTLKMFNAELQDDVRDIAARTRELATYRLHTIPEFIFDVAVNRMVELTGRTTAVHAVIDAMTNSRPSASRYIKNVHHSGSHFLRPHEYAAIIQTAKNTGIPGPAITELCHRLGLTEETMVEFNISQYYQVPEEKAIEAAAVISMISMEAGEEAARQLGWDEDLAHKALIGNEDDEDEDEEDD
jgi:hypothetical protein